MLQRADRSIRERLTKLENHLENENPVLLDAVQRFKKLDVIAYRMGLLSTDESYATRIPWWPLISILGTFSSGKSSFINQFLDEPIQRTGNQAVDDKFTVMTFAKREGNHVLPGVALDSDPRFPFFHMSDEIDKVAPGEGRRIDAYLQMKTSSSEKLRGKILIDSPGFDADDQRNAILRLTDHIIDLSDLVLVFFDARHPEPGAMQDTLEHLVAETIKRSDSEKFLFVLNQIDTAAQEDNPEAVVAAWQRALAAKGLTAGRFYTIYNEAVAVPIQDAAVKQRFEAKRDNDLAEIVQRLHQVEIERSYRIIGTIESIADEIEKNTVPTLEACLERWRRAVMVLDVVGFSALIALLYAMSAQIDLSSLFSFDLSTELWFSVAKILVILAVPMSIHYAMRRFARKWIVRSMRRSGDIQTSAGDLVKAFRRGTRFFHSIFLRRPAGWGMRRINQLRGIREEASELVQTLNDRFTDPSGNTAAEVLSVIGAHQQDEHVPTGATGDRSETN